MKNIEDFIKDHRADFDQLHPFDEVKGWSDLERKRKLRIPNWLSIAAGVLIIVTAGYFVFFESANQEKSLSSESAIFAQLASEYDQQINQRWEKLDPQKIDHIIWNEIDLEIKMLDSMKIQMEKDYSTTIEKERMLQLMRKYYERKLRILDLLENEVNKFENYKNKPDEI